MCNHPIDALVGGGDGIKCTVCGKLFKTYDWLLRDCESAPAEEPAPKPKAKKERKNERV